MALAYDRRAWVWAACPDPKLRDGKRAVESATKACELTNWREPRFLHALAAAHAEAGDFDSAVQWQTKALAFATNPSENQEQRARLLLYQDKKPYRMRKP
jgi:hypothetical protein